MSALSGPRWIDPHDGWYAPTSSMTRSKGPSRRPMSPNSGVRPVSPLKKTRRRPVSMTHDDQSVAVGRAEAPAREVARGRRVEAGARPTAALSHQSSSVMRSGATPHASRCAPTPSDVTNGTSRFASARIVVWSR